MPGIGLQFVLQECCEPWAVVLSALKELYLRSRVAKPDMYFVLLERSAKPRAAPARIPARCARRRVRLGACPELHTLRS